MYSSVSFTHRGGIQTVTGFYVIEILYIILGYYNPGQKEVNKAKPTSDEKQTQKLLYGRDILANSESSKDYWLC